MEDYMEILVGQWKARIVEGSSKIGGRVTVALVLTLFLNCLAAFADDGAAQASSSGVEMAAGESNHRGFYYAFPAYLYGSRSAAGVQAGYQLKHVHFRLDASQVIDIEDGRTVIFANPSISVFYSEDWESKIRTYQGVSLGIETGILNSFAGQAYFLNLLTGAEWFIFERKAVYLEIGTGLGIMTKNGAYNGGTVIGGGIKCFF
jgi:hypothetical protein